MKPRIIIVDDDREMCEELREILEDEGYWVRTACDGLDGLAMIEKHGCELVLLDLKMPGLTGEEVIKRMSEWQARPKVIIVTASLLGNGTAMQDPTKQTGWGLVSGVVGKPIELSALLRKIRKLIG